MNFKEILELIDKVAERGIAGVEVEQAGTKVRIEGKSSQQQHVFSYVGEGKPPAPALPAIPMAALPLAAAPTEESVKEAKKKEEEEREAGLHIITSPIVGTFYRQPNPEAHPFVNVGDRVSKGKVLCIIEAMKLMNEIESDVEGVVVEVYPQNGQPVEYGEKLFAVKV
ncbi:MAG TPA: acetyl-CoA carboxylase biotin carboxyl carrier protein [Thermoanaerobaculia bacterium]|nr:acetyl-CoA carboxylase biotin carboxyl carrier protein [Thermoanaerobaculia bacterium]